MEVVIFILVIIALILVHEFGHFVAAKLSGMRVDEFGLGYPPRALTIAKVGETRYTLNWIPFGGFVKIYGEDSDLLSAGVSEPRAFTSKNRLAQAFVLIAGIAMNLLFAYLLITGALIIGTPRALAPSEIAGARQVQLAVASLVPDSPAARAGVMPGDSIISATDARGQWSGADPETFTQFIAASGGNAVTLDIEHNGVDKKSVITPATGVVLGDLSRYALGIAVATIGIVPVSFGSALVQGASLTWQFTQATALGLWHFFFGVFTLSADLSQVAGPIGIAGVVGGAAANGLGNLLSLMAIISINLALINLIPIPALDGGRLLFVLIEGIMRRPIKVQVARTVNSIGFAFLILLMVVVSAHDIYKIVV